jgi:hypothetical protein
MRQFTAILSLCLIGVIAAGQRVQKFKLISSFDSPIDTELFVHEIKGGELKFVRDTLDVVTVFLPNRETTHLRIFSPAHGSFETKLKKPDTSTIIAFLDAHCPVDPSTAASDTLNGTPKILIASGYSLHGLTLNDRDFKQLFGVDIIDYGDLWPCDNCMAYYNKVVFQYLDHKYQGAWRKLIVNRPVGY